jgi:hypothetical protein
MRCILGVVFVFVALFAATNVYAEEMSITKCTVTFGTTEDSDTIAVLGKMDATTNDFSASLIVVSIDSDNWDYPYIQDFPINGTTFKKGQYKCSITEGSLKTSFTFNTRTGKFSFTAENVDLSGLGYPLTIGIEIGDYYAETEVNEAAHGPKKQIPTAPTGVTASADDGQVSISWSAVSGATSYNIYWSTTSGVTKTNGIKITGATNPYSHTGLTNDTTYYYIVTAVNSSGESVESEEVSATPTAAGTGTHTASGTYTWNSSTGVITWNWTSSNFVCDGPEVGTDTETGVTITSTTMTWSGGDNMTWTRSSGTANDIVGTWTASDSTTGNSWTLTFNANDTVSVVGVIVQCGEGGGGQNPSASLQHWSSGYYVPLEYNDSSQPATSVSVTGPGITGFLSLAYDADRGSWNSWVLSQTPFLGTTDPIGLPYTYTFTITDGTGTWTANSTVSCFQEHFATNLSPTGTVSGSITFSWTGIGDSAAEYQVQLSGPSGDRIWDSSDVPGTSVAYTGPALTSGTTYYYDVVVTQSSTCDEESFAQGSFTVSE